MVQYIFHEDEPLKIKNAKMAQAQVIGDALDEIRLARGGELQPMNVVDAARDPKHALHPHFEWDDSVAAEAFRLDQARSIIRIVRIADDSLDEGSARAFISIASDKGVSYRSLDEVKRSSDLRAAVLAGAERDLDAFQRRYRELKEICALVEPAKQAVRSRRQRSGAQENRAGA